MGVTKTPLGIQVMRDRSIALTPPTAVRADSV
jgi:hypothetical protein